MLAVVDANELFSLLIRGTSESEEIFVSNKLQLIAPEFMLIEFLNNKEEILSKTHRTEEEFSRLLSLFERRIKFIAQEEFNEFVPTIPMRSLHLAVVRAILFIDLAIRCELSY